jgi:excisionase family DNA binding protein
MTIKQIADALGIAPSTVHRWLNDGIISGEQLTPGAPWRIRLSHLGDLNPFLEDCDCPLLKDQQPASCRGGSTVWPAS